MSEVVRLVARKIDSRKPYSRSRGRNSLTAVVPSEPRVQMRIYRLSLPLSNEEFWVVKAGFGSYKESALVSFQKCFSYHICLTVFSCTRTNLLHSSPLFMFLRLLPRLFHPLAISNNLNAIQAGGFRIAMGTLIVTPLYVLSWGVSRMHSSSDVRKSDLTTSICVQKPASLVYSRSLFESRCEASR